MSDDDWPTITLTSSKSGAKLFNDGGTLIGYLYKDGTHSFLAGREQERITQWEAFGDFTPAEVTVLEDSVTNLINRLAQRYGG